MLPDTEAIIHVEEIVVQLLLVVTLVATMARRIRLPYTVALVLAGLVLTFNRSFRIELTPGLVTAFFLPPLLFEAAFHIRYEDIRRDLGALVALAVPGVILGTLITAGVLHGLGILSLPLALVFGSLISATDPVAVVALFRELGAPRRLTTLLEGESLLNDGTAIVIFGLMVQFALSDLGTPAEALVEFTRVSVFGVAIGYGLGWVAVRVFRAIDDHLIETTITTVLAFGSYLLAEELHVSGVLAVVVAGLVAGNAGRSNMSPTTRVVLINFWEYVAFLANSCVFLLIGTSVKVNQLTEFAPTVAFAIVAVLVSRALTIYLIGALLRLVRRGTPIPAAYLHMMIWGGLRGAVALALALGLTKRIELADRELLQAMTFGVVLFTLLVQATTVAPLLRRLRLSSLNPFSQLYEQLQGKILSLGAARRHLDDLHKAGVLFTRAWKEARREVEDEETAAMEELNHYLEQDPTQVHHLVMLARQEARRAQRSSLETLGREGLIRHQVLDDLLTEVDQKLDARQ